MPQILSTEKTQSQLPPGLPPHDSFRELGAYIIPDRTAVAAFVSEHRLGDLLLEARGPLDLAFGPQAAKSLRLVCDDEGFETLFCLVSLSDSPEHALEARASFDRAWWLERCATVSGRLNFDFELA